MTKTEQTKQVIINALTINSNMSPSEIKTLCSEYCSERTIRRVVSNLVEHKLIQRNGSGNNITYSLFERSLTKNNCLTFSKPVKQKFGKKRMYRAFRRNNRKFIKKFRKARKAVRENMNFSDHWHLFHNDKSKGNAQHAI